VSAEDYEHAKAAFTTLGCKTVRDYTLAYLKGDVAQLADVVESFRALCQTAFGLEPFHYVSAPGLAQDACFKTTQKFREDNKIDIELFNEKQADMLHFVERGIRGGISMISHRHAKATPATSTTPATEIRYLDANNLYGWSMSQKLPTGDFKWLENVSVADVLTMDADGARGAFVECDLHVPPELHGKFNDYPMAPETMMVDGDLISPWNREVAAKLGLTIAACTKLVPHLMDKKNYVCHIRNLQLYARHGLVITKVHRVLDFAQHAWMKPFIDMTAAGARRRNSTAKNSM
jgi:hypothetical protein